MHRDVLVDDFAPRFHFVARNILLVEICGQSARWHVEVLDLVELLAYQSYLLI